MEGWSDGPLLLDGPQKISTTLDKKNLKKYNMGEGIKKSEKRTLLYI